MVLSYAMIGATLSPSMHFDRLLLTLLAYFLGLGVAAHALNELHARHWGKALTKLDLTALFVASLTAALVIGGYGVIVLYESSQGYCSIVLSLFIVLETAFLFAYNLGYSKFHSDLAFAFSWGALPCLISYYVNSLALSLIILVIGSCLSVTAAIEINLSRWCKTIRRSGSMTRFGEDQLSTKLALEGPEKALKLIVVAVDLLGLGLLMWRLFGS